MIKINDKKHLRCESLVQILFRFSGGHLYLQIVKEKLQLWLNTLRSNILKLARGSGFNLSSAEIQKAARLSGGIETSLEMFLATGKI